MTAKKTCLLRKPTHTANRTLPNLFFPLVVEFSPASLRSVQELCCWPDDPKRNELKTDTTRLD